MFYLPTIRTYRPQPNGTALLTAPLGNRIVLMEHNPTTGATRWLHTNHKGA